MQKEIAVIHGDGIGPEIINGALKIIKEIEKKFKHNFNIKEVIMGGVAIDEYGEPLPAQMLEACLDADAVLLGAIGGPKWESLPGDERPERGLLALRKGMGLYANLRPARLFTALSEASPLKADIAKGIDLLVMRELIGGVYFGIHETREENGQKIAKDVMEYSQEEIRRIMYKAFDAARVRRKKVTSVDKANVLDTSRLWRLVANEIASEYPDVEFENMLVDNAAMQLVKNPAQFDVIVTENMFGDILSDEASMITGSIGMIPSASMGEGTKGLYEPIHGSAPDIAGQNLANPVGTILSVAMMFRYSFEMQEEAALIEKAVSSVLEKGIRTKDMMSEGMRMVTCSEMSDEIVRELGCA